MGMGFLAQQALMAMREIQVLLVPLGKKGNLVHLGALVSLKALRGLVVTLASLECLA